jgi:predicted RNase H-like HicB family nuclease
MKFTAVYHKPGLWWIGNIEELPGASAKGKTIEECRDSLTDAVRMYLLMNRMSSEMTYRDKEVVKEEFSLPVE